MKTTSTIGILCAAVLAFAWTPCVAAGSSDADIEAFLVQVARSN